MGELDRDRAAALRRDLAAAGVDALSLPALIGEEAVAALARQVSAPARRRLAGLPVAARTLIAAFGLGDEVAVDDLAAALPEVGLSGAAHLGVVEVVDDRARATVAIRPWLTADGGEQVSWWVVSDHDELSGVMPLPPDHVLGVGGAGRTLAALLPTGPVESALDLGCGCGLIALQLARRASRVVATDISERALWCTQLTCALNGVTNVETRLGSLLDPVQGERFDLIACNPPFVITPRTGGQAWEYRDAGLVGDQVMATLLAGLGQLLTDSGTAWLLGNWESSDAGPGAERVLDWVGENSCWLIERERLSPESYAELWVRDGGVVPSSALGSRLVASWLDDFDARGVTEVGLGWVALAGGPGPQRVEQLAHPLDLAQVGLHWGDAFAALRELDRLDDAELGALRLVTAPDVADVRYFAPGVADPSVLELRQGGWFARTIGSGTALTALLGALDGDYDLATLIAAVAGLLEVDAAELSAELLPQVRELLIAGMVTVAGSGHLSGDD